MPSCPFCSNPLSEEDEVCDVCGSNIIKAPEKIEPETISPRTATRHKKQSAFDEALDKLPFKVTDALLKRSALILAVALVFSFIISFFKPVPSSDYILYGKDEEVFFSKELVISPKQITVDYGKNYFDNNLGLSYRLSDNGKKVLFFDYGSNNLYYRNSKLNKESVFLASNVLTYDINDSGNLITYIKDGNQLYQHNFKHQLNIIDNNVVAFVMSNDGKTILYTKRDGKALNLYRYKFGKVSESVISSIDSVSYISDDLKTVIYIKKGSFYKEKIGSKPQTIISDIHKVVKVYDENKLYFVASDPETYTDSLYYFNGRNAKLVMSGYTGFTECAEDLPAIAFSALKDGETSYFVAVEDKASVIEKAVFDNVYVDPSGKSIYFIADVDPKTFLGNLYKASLSKSGVKGVKLIDTEVYGGKYLYKGKFAYLKNYDPQTFSGEVFLNGKSLGAEISWSEMSYSSEKNGLIFFRNTNGRIGDMYFYKNGRSKLVAEKVLMSNYFLTDNGNVLYLADYSEAYSVGELFIFNGSKSKHVDVGVSFISDTYNGNEFTEFLKQTLIS